MGTVDSSCVEEEDGARAVACYQVSVYLLFRIASQTEEDGCGEFFLCLGRFDGEIDHVDAIGLSAVAGMV